MLGNLRNSFTFSVQDQFKRNKKLKTHRQIINFVSNVLPRCLGDMDFIKEQIRLNIIFISTDTQVSSSIRQIYVPIDENPVWYTDLLSDYDVSNIFGNSENGPVTIEFFDREEIANFPFVYAFYSKKTHSESDFETPKYLNDGKISYVWDWMIRLIKLLQSDLLAMLKNVDAVKFAELLIENKLIVFIDEKIRHYLKDDTIYEDSYTFKLEQFLDRYLHIRGDNVAENFFFFIKMKFSVSLQCLFYYARPRFLNYIYTIHLNQKRNGEPSEISAKEYQIFWERLLDDFFLFTVRSIELGQIKQLICNRSVCLENVLSKLGEMCQQIIFDENKTISIASEEDFYSDLFKHIRIPIFYQWPVKREILHSQSIMKQLINNGRLTLQAEFGDTSNLIGIEISRSLLSSSSVYIVRKFDSKILVYEMNDNAYVIKVNTDVYEAPLLHVAHVNGPVNDMMIDPHKGGWFLYNQKTKKFVKQPTILREQDDKNIKLLIENKI